MRNIMDIITNYWPWLLPIAMVLIIVVVFLVRKRFVRKINFAGIELDFGNINNDDRSKHVQIFARSDSAEFAKYFEKLASQAHRVVLIGTGINILHHDPILVDLIERTKEKCELEIYAANPYSPSIEMRLIEEETGDKNNIRPPLGKSGLIGRLKTILEKQRQMGAHANLTLRLFTNYPTLSIYIIDNDYFFYPYGCT